MEVGGIELGVLDGLRDGLLLGTIVGKEEVGRSESADVGGALIGF